MISEGSCDTEEYSNDSENTTLTSYLKRNIEKREKVIFKTNAALNIRILFQQHFTHPRL